MCTPAMRRRLPQAVPWPLALIGSILLGAAYVRAADKPEESPIRAAAKSFVEAFDRGDAKAVAAHWTENGSLVDDQGRVFKGRKAIEEEYAAFFKAIPGVKMKVAIQSIEFPTPVTAVEDGTATVSTFSGRPAGCRPVHGRPRARQGSVADGQCPRGTDRNRLGRLAAPAASMADRYLGKEVGGDLDANESLLGGGQEVHPTGIQHS